MYSKLSDDGTFYPALGNEDDGPTFQIKNGCLSACSTSPCVWTRTKSLAVVGSAVGLLVIFSVFVIIYYRHAATDVDECKDSPCHSNQTCFNIPGSYMCHLETPCTAHTQPDGSCTECLSPYEKWCNQDSICYNAMRWCQLCDLFGIHINGECSINACKRNQFMCDLGRCVANKLWYDGSDTNCFDESDEHDDSSYSFWDTYFDDLDVKDDNNDWVCQPDFRQCTGGYQCVHTTYFCDGLVDCTDASDEHGCNDMTTNTFKCDTNRTLARRKRCDGHKDCTDGSDEPHNCECLAGQFKCDNGHCVEDSDRCNGEDECGDSSDEDNCDINCTSRGYQCGDNCILLDQVCDGNIDCDDRTDEMNCDCSQDFRFQCSNGACIRSVFVCNGIDDCTDGSDETGCDYCRGDDHFVCASDKSCIPGFAVCDGEGDCPQGEDEHNCNSSCDGQFTCPNQTCISLSRVCDGVSDCDAGSDELKCVRLEADVNGVSGGSSLLVLQHHRSWYPVCADGLPDRIGSDACTELGMGSNGTMTSQNMGPNWPDVSHDQGWVKIVSEGYSDNVPLMKNFKHVMNCSSEHAAFITCTEQTPRNDITCGMRSLHLNTASLPLIIGGRQSQEGRWPWMVQLIYQNMFICGGSIISDRWILTAGHCAVGLFSEIKPTDFTIKVGSIRQNNKDPYTKSYKIQTVIQHKHYDSSTLENDIALMKTSSPIEYTDYIRPVCLPQAHQDQSSQTHCYMAGWGTYTLFGAMPEILREMRVNILPVNVCEVQAEKDEYGPHMHVVSDDMICVGYTMGDACYGDSGSPVVCRQPDDTWKQIGLVSWGPAPSCRTDDLFTNITTYIPWIKQHTGLTFS